MIAPARISVALCAMLLAACSAGPNGPQARQGGTLFVALDTDPASLNPLVANDPVSAQAYAPLFPLLYSANADLSVGPDLAAGAPVTSGSGTVLTVTLRADAKWSDGMPMTADDVVYTVNTERDRTLATHAVFNWSRLKSVTKVDGLTVKFTLLSADATFIAESLVTPIVPQHAFAHLTPAQIATAPFSSGPTVTGGPFKFDHRVAGQAIYLNANPGYFLGNPHLDHVVETIGHDSKQIVDQLQNGKLSWVPLLQADAAGSAASAPGLTVSAYPDTAFKAVMFNVRAGHVFADHALRQAFAYSIAHDSLVSQATGDAQGYPVWGDINPNSWAFEQGAAAQYVPDSGRARQLLGQAGWTAAGSGPATRGGRLLTAQLIYPSGDASRGSAATMLTQQASANGIGLTAKGLGDAAFNEAVASGSFEAAVVSLPTGLDPDASAILASGGRENYGGYTNPTLDALLSSEVAAGPAAGENVRQVRKPLFTHIEQIVSTDLPLYFLWVPRAFTGFNATVGGVAGVGPQLVDDRADSFYRDWYLTA